MESKNRLLERYYTGVSSHSEDLHLKDRVKEDGGVEKLTFDYYREVAKIKFHGNRDYNFMHSNWKLLGIAASVSIVLISIFLVSKYINKPIHLVANQEVIHYKFPDQSQCWINQNSSVQFDKGFNSENRTVNLSGEAYFEVRKNDLPFRILLSDAVIEVMGTSFNINASAKSVSVSVLSGVVKYQSSDKNAEKQIFKGQTFVVRKDNDHKVTNNDHNLLAWKERKLIFKDDSLHYVFNTVSKFFNKQFVMEIDRLDNCTYTGTFKNPEENEIIELLSYSLSLIFTKTESGYIITGSGC